LREGTFDPDRMIALLISETEKALSEGYPALRVTGEMTWVLGGLPGSDRLLEYEARLNTEVFPKYPCLAICQYERAKFDPAIIKGVIMTHPLVVVSNRIYRNFYYIPPEKFLRTKRDEAEVGSWLENLHQINTAIDALRESEEKYRMLFEQVMDGLAVADVETGILIECNEALAAMVGRDKRELIGQPQRILHPEEQWVGDVTTSFKEHRGEKQGKVIETQIVTKSGEVREVEIKANAFHLHGRTVLQGIFRDVTERKRAEEQLRESEEKFRALFNQSTEGIYLHDLEGRILDVNEMACVQSGYSREEWLGLTVFDGHPSQSTTNLSKDEVLRIWSEWTPGQRFTFEAEHKRKDGTVYPVEISKGIVRYQGKNAILAIVKDITERKRAEAELQRRAEDLRIRNEALTRFNTVAVGRELRMIELKREVNELCLKLGEPPRYKIVTAPQASDTPPEERV